MTRGGMTLRSGEARYMSMKRFSATNFTFGYKIEFGDIDRRVIVPPDLGKWEAAKTTRLSLFDCLFDRPAFLSVSLGVRFFM